MREDGLIIITDCGHDGVIHQPTIQCRHCGCHWVPQPGSGNVRGFCARCNGPVCGPKCAACVPVEVMLENLEAGRPEGYRRLMLPSGWEG